MCSRGATLLQWNLLIGDALIHDSAKEAKRRERTRQSLLRQAKVCIDLFVASNHTSDANCKVARVAYLQTIIMYALVTRIYPQPQVSPTMLELLLQAR